MERDSEEGSLLLDGFDDDVINEIQGSSITYRIAVGSQRGKKVFTLKTLPAKDDDMDEISGQTLAKAAGFSLHADVSAKSHQLDKVERLCRYIARPAVSTHRLERLPDGTLSYELKTPYKNGTTHVVFEPLDFIARLAALVPKPRFHLTRFHGVFAPNSKHRAAACCRLEFINERKSHRKIQSYQAGLVDLSWVWIGLAIKCAGFNSVSVDILVMVFLGIGKLGV